jgi:alpha-N-arabinofuranosidase
VDASKTGAPIHRFIYGQFTELLFNLFEKGLWAEMLSDRKFFYPVDDSEVLVPKNTKRNFMRWRPVGGAAVVTMDRKNAYVGEHAPAVRLDATTPRGIRQAGLPLRKGRKYTGSVLLAGDTGAKVTVSLVWGPDANERQTIATGPLTARYARFPLRFTAGADNPDAALEITGTGRGTFRIGVVSLMPADNVHGFRADMIRLLKDLDQGIYRWPGGNFVSGYDWRDGVGDRDKRPPRYDYAWNTVEYNDVGTDEFLTLCRLVSVEPYLCVNSGFGDDHSAAEWLEYCNGAATSPMGKLRAGNGHPAPYRIQWWNIGNEMYGQWQLGHMDIDHYVLKHNLFAKAMRRVDPSILLVASGATLFEINTVSRLHRKPLPGRLPYEYLSHQDWSGQLLLRSSDYFEYLAEHLYPVLDSAFDIDDQAFVRTNDPLEDQIRRLPNRVRAAVEALQEYERRIPGLKDKKIKLAIDEWAGGGRRGFVRALAAAETLMEMFRHSGVIEMAAYTAFISNLNYDGNDSVLSSVGMVFRLFRHHYGSIPVAVSGNAPQKPVKGTIGVDKPAVSSGSDTYPLDVAAALTADKKKLTVAVVNPTEVPRDMDLTLTGVSLLGSGTLRKIVAPNLQADNEPGKEPMLKVEESRWTEVPASLTAPPLSISLYEFELK